MKPRGIIMQGDSDTRENLRRAIAAHCSAIEELFLPGAKVTVIVRNPGVPGDADVLVTNDDDAAILAAIKRRMGQ